MKKLIILIIIILTFTTTTFSQIGINTDGSSPDASAILDVKSVDKGLLIPRMTTTQRTSIISPVEGLMVYDTDLGSLCFYRAGEWNQSLYSTSGWSLKGNADIDHTTDFLGTVDNNALVFKYNNTSSGLIDSTSTFMGYTAGEFNAGSHSTLVGSGAGLKITNGNSNTALGYHSLNNSTTGSNNTALGSHAGFSITTGSNNIVIGCMADVPSDTSDNQMVIGSQDLFYGDLLNNRIGIGTVTPRQQLEITGNFVLPSTTDSTGIIYRDSVPWLHSFKAAGTDGLNVFLGNQCGNLTLTDSYTGDEGSRNTAVGDLSLNGLTTGKLNCAFGVQALQSNSTGICNTGIGYLALNANTTVNYLTAVGAFALRKNTSGVSNTAVGFQASEETISAYNNTTVGYQSFRDRTVSYSNVAIGSLAMGGADSVVSTTNVAVGNGALRQMKGGACNVAVGTGALENVHWALDNVGIGTGALDSLQNGIENIGIGVFVMNDKRTGDANTVIGQYALWKNLSGGNNVGLGNRVGYWNTGSGNIFIGDSAAYFETGSDKLYIDNSPISEPLIYGDLANDSIRINGDLGATKNFELLNTSSSAIGVIYKGNNRFIHDYKPEFNTGMNTFIGSDAGNFTMNGPEEDDASYNTGLGRQVMNANTSGAFNTAVGSESLQSNTRGSKNVMLGYQAGNSITTGSNNIAIGYMTDVPSGTADNQLVIGSQHLLYGDLLNYRLGIGTNTPLQKIEVKGGNLLMSSSDSASEIRFAEPFAGGLNYTAFKAQTQAEDVTYTLPAADGANGNILSTDGAGLLSWTTAFTGDLTSIGSIISGDAFAGPEADGNWLGLGASSGRIEFDDLSTDEINILDAFVGIGTDTPGQQLEITGNFMIPVSTEFTGIIYSGTSRFVHNFGAGNVFLGKDAGNLTLSGIGNNTGLGDSTLNNLTTGCFNVALGSSALKDVTTGSFNTALGYSAGCSENDTNTIALGYLASADACNQVRLGNSAITSLYCQGAYLGTVGPNNVDLLADITGKIGYKPSSARYKDNIYDMEDVDWLYGLRPVNFTYKSDEMKKKQYGLIAEEVEKINQDFVHYNQDGLVETVSYSQLIAPLIKAVQEQNNTIEVLKGDIDLIKAEREQLLRNQEMLLSRLEALEKERESFTQE